MAGTCHAEPIAIIGSSCRFPGGADRPSKLWDNLREPRDLLTSLASRFDPQAFYHPDAQYHGTTNVQHSYLLSEHPGKFDAQFFGISAVEAAAIDPQHRLLLETVYEGLESAGIAIEHLQGTNTAAYVGLMCGDYEHMMLRDFNTMPTYHATGTSRAILSNRLSYFFDWHGPSMTVDTACSSSLVAVHLAVKALRNGETNVAIAAGSNLILGPEHYIMESKLKMLSPDSQCRMWDDSANGYGRGEGVAALILKTLTSALRDGDHVECIIRETGVNQDGKSKGITMPSSEAQATLIRDTYARAGLDPRSKKDRCQFFEAHGTGTPTGDPLEAEAINAAFFDSKGCRDLSGDILHVGSVKTVLGHTEGTAGLAGILKMSLALQNRIVPPNLLFNRLSPAIEPFYENLQIPTAQRPWPDVVDGQPRRASVNSFGFGGTNAHIILESFDGGQATSPLTSSLEIATYSANFLPFTFSAQTKSALSSILAEYSNYLKKNPQTNVHDLAWTLRFRRSALPLKATFTATSADVLHSKIDAVLEKAKADNNASIGVRASLPSGSRPRILGVFTGQGAQWPRMGAELIEHSTFVQDIISRLESRLQRLPEPDRPSWSLISELLAGSSSSRLDEAAIAQPLCTAIQIALIDILRASGIKVDAIVGHSGGETAAAYAAGYYSAEDAICVAYYRGLHAHLAEGKQGQKGAMLAVGTSLEDAQEVCNSPEFEGRICVAASNSPTSVTISGDADAIAEVKIIFDDEKKFTRMLKVAQGYHSHHMLKASDAFVSSLRGCHISIDDSSAKTPWYSSVHLEEASKMSGKFAHVYWDENMCMPVLFSQAIELGLAHEEPFDIAMEIGPHPALKGPVSQVLQEKDSRMPYIGLLSRGKNDIETLADALGSLWTSFGETAVDMKAFDRAMSGGREASLVTGLPSYAWDHDRVYWHESRISKTMRTRAEPVHELLGRQSPDSNKQQMQWNHLLKPKEIPWVHGHQLQGQTVFPAAGYVVTALEAAQGLAPNATIKTVEIRDFVIFQAMTFDEDASEIEVTFTINNINHGKGDSITGCFTYHAVLGKGSDAMTLVAKGELSLELGDSAELALPPREPPESSMVDVPTQDFYSTLTEMGYQYTGPFMSLSSMKRKLGSARGRLTNHVDEHSKHKLMIHPAVLDGAFLAVILAFSYPRDGSLWALHVPTSIRRITVNPFLGKAAQPGALLHFDSNLGDVAKSTIEGDVDIFDEGGRSAILQVEGMHAVPFSGATADNDTHVFSKIVWGAADPTGDDLTDSVRATPAEYDLAQAMEHAAYWYLRNLDSEIPQSHPARSEGPYGGLFGFIKHVKSLVSSGTHAYIDVNSNDERYEEVVAPSKSLYPDCIDFQLLHAVGENMPAVIRGETTILEHLMHDNLLNRYYTDALGNKEILGELGRMLGQISHRYPHMKILEIGAGTGSATKSALESLDGRFVSYTFTDVSAGFFEKAQARFSLHEDKIIFKVLDIEKDLTGQDFSENSYDLIIASFVLHATQNLEKTMRNVRRLLKPGGYVAMVEITDNDQIRLGSIFGALPGWWLGANDGRTLSPCITKPEWDSVLRNTGFSGVDTTTSDTDRLPYPIGVIISQALDDNIERLRYPLSMPLNIVIEDLVILGGSTLKMAQLIGEMTRLLRPFCTRVKSVTALENLTAKDFSENTTVLSLTELDDQIFKSLTAEKFHGLKATFGSASTLLWVTQGCRDDSPYSNMIRGFGQSLLWENPGITTQFLDINVSERPDGRSIAGTLLRLKIAKGLQSSGQYDALLWSVEPELSIEDGLFHVPRVVFDDEMNTRNNSSRRNMTKDVLLAENVIEIDRTAMDHTVREGQPVGSFLASTSMRVSHTIPWPINTKTHDMYIALGSVREGTQVVSLADRLASVIQTDQELTKAVKVPAGREDEFMTLMATTSILAHAIASKSPTGGTLLVHEPEPLLATILSERMVSEKATVSYTTTAMGAPGPPTIVIHPQASRRAIKMALPDEVTAFVDCSTSSAPNDVVKQITACLPRQCNIFDRNSLLPDENNAGPFSRRILHASVATSESHLGLLSNILNMKTVTLSDVAESTNSDALNAIIRWNVTSAVPCRVEPVNSRPIFASDKTYWLVGLTGGLGLSLTEWMVRHGAKYFALSSRNPNIDASWLKKMKALGVTIQVFSSDVTVKDDLQMVYDKICDTLPPIAGIHQAAMVLQDVSVRDMSFDQMMKTLRPKVDGSAHLDALFRDHDLEFFIFFSSLASVVGNIGQANYTAANAFMTSLAAQRRKRGLAASSIDIGALAGVGYITASPAQVAVVNKSKGGYMWMSERNFHTAIAEAVVAGRPDSGRSPQIITGLQAVKAGEKEQRIWHDNPKFANLVLQEATAEQSNLQTKSSVSIKAQLLDASSQDQVKEILLNHFMTKLQSLLHSQLDKTSISGIRTDELGIDSLVAVEIGGWFIKTLTVNMPVLKILGGISIGDLLNYALDNLPNDLIPNVAARKSPIPDIQEPIAATAVAAAAPTQNTASLLQVGLGLQEPRPTINGRELSSLSIPTSETALHSDSPSDRSINSDDTTPSTQSDWDSDRETHFPPSRRKFDKVAPLSFTQSMFWFLNLYLEHKTDLNTTGISKIRGCLDINRMAHAIQVVGQRHEALRTAFFTDENNEVKQAVLPTPTLYLERKNVKGQNHVDCEFELVKRHTYDIKNGNVTRIVLLSLTPNDHHLIIGSHHICLDGMSTRVLLSDMQDAYVGKPLIRDMLQYIDFTENQREEYLQGKWRDELEFWKKEFPSPPAVFPLLALSQRTSRSSLLSYSLETAKNRLDPETTSRVRQLCSLVKVTPFHFYLSTFKALLSRYLEIDELCIGIGDGGRMNSNTLGSIGPFMNLLPLKFRISGNQTFEAALLESRSKSYSALANSRVPFEVLLDELQVPRSAAHSPLFQTFINYRQSGSSKMPFGDCELEIEEVEGAKAAYDLSMDVVDYGSDGTLLVMMGQASLYSKDAVDILMTSYVNLLEPFLEKPKARLSLPNLYRDSDVEEAIKIGRGPLQESKWPETISHRIDDICLAKAKEIALIDDKRNSLSYGQMARRVDDISTALLAKVPVGSIVAVFLEPSLDWVCCLLAILRIGSVYLPLDVDTPVARLSAMVKDSKPKVMLVHNATRNTAKEFGVSKEEVVDIESLSPPISTPSPNAALANAPAVVLYTSGSTGVPKGIILKHSNIQNEVEGHLDLYGMTSEVVLQQSALGFDMSLSQVFGALASGGRLCIAPRAARGDPLALTKLIDAWGITSTYVTPSEIVGWLQHGDTKALRKSEWKRIVAGGEQIPPSLIHELRTLAKKDMRAFNAYGPTEISFASNKGEIEYQDRDTFPERISAGLPAPNYCIYIMDEHLDPLPLGVPGEIVIGGAGVTLGYLNNDELTAQRFLSDLFAPSDFQSKGWTTIHRTGDRGRLQRDGSLLIEGRLAGDTQVKLRGLRIDLRDVESSIMKAGNGKLSATVVSLHHSEDDGPEYLVAHTVFASQTSLEGREEYLRQLASDLPLPRYMRPAAIVELAQLPLTSSRKIDRAAVGRLPLSETQDKHQQTIPLTHTSSLLRDIWIDVLPAKVANISAIEAGTDFFSVGGNSLLLVTLQTKIKSVFGITLPLIQLFESSTLKGMAARIASNEENFEPDLIDWEKETSLPPDLGMDAALPRPAQSGTDRKIVVLTGATGSLGKVILQRLISDKTIAKIHCIAVRAHHSPASLSNSSKVIMHHGDLSHTHLGLTPQLATALFSSTDLIIHNGAEVSHQKSYQSLRAANVQSTKELVRLSISHRTPFHYVSSAGVSHLGPAKENFGEVSAASLMPPMDGSDGYNATKWVSERFLERVAERFPDMPIWVHRPSSIVKEGSGEGDLDIIQSMLKYSRLMLAVPMTSKTRGTINLVSVEEVAYGIYRRLGLDNEKPPEAGMRYVHQIGEDEFDIENTADYLGRKTGDKFAEMGMIDWVTKARELGLNSLLADFYLEAEKGEEKVFPRLVRT